MEATLNQEVAIETIAAETKTDEVRELSNVELLLVGGGIANVSFC